MLAKSTDLLNWGPVCLLPPMESNGSLTIPTGDPLTYYRVIGVPGTSIRPAFQNAIEALTEFSASGSMLIDSFDSSTVPGGQYQTAYRQANAILATPSSATNAIYLDNESIYGYVCTGSGGFMGLGMGPKSSVGDVAWITNGAPGIEAGHLLFSINHYPDVPAPDTTGWSTRLPLPGTNGAVTLAGGNYVVPLVSAPLVISSNVTTLWVQGSFSRSLTITNAGQLILYLGRTNGSGDNFNYSVLNNLNVPGYAANLQIYGLPGLTSINFTGNGSWMATIYAPEASLVANGTQEDVGAIVANSVLFESRCNFHYDQSLVITGPALANGWLFTGTTN